MNLTYRVLAADTARVCTEVICGDLALIGQRADNGALGTVCGNFCAAGVDQICTQ